MINSLAGKETTPLKGKTAAIASSVAMAMMPSMGG
jgi:hypothetical protein